MYLFTLKDVFIFKLSRKKMLTQPITDCSSYLYQTDFLSLNRHIVN